MAARPDSGLSQRVVEGQENPVQGWLPRGLSGVRPAPVGIFSARGTDVNLLYVLAPAAADILRGRPGLRGTVRQRLGGSPAHNSVA